MAAGFIIFESGMEMMPDQFTGISGSMSPSHVSVCSVVLMVSVTQGAAMLLALVFIAREKKPRRIGPEAT